MSTPSPPSRGAQSVFVDGLHTIFSFLTRLDVASASATCRLWSSAARSEPPRRVRCRVYSVEELHELTQAATGRHVGQIDLCGAGSDLALVLAAALPHLTDMTCEVDVKLLQDGASLAFPSTLRALDIQIVELRDQLWTVWRSLRFLLSQVARVPLTTLRVRLKTEESGVLSPGVIKAADSIRPLLALRETLTDLQVPREFTWLPEQIAILRSLPHLTRLVVQRGEWGGGEWRPEELAMIAADPTPVQIQSVGSFQSPTPSTLDSISRLAPALTDLTIRYVFGGAQPLACFERLLKLHTLKINFDAEIKPAVCMQALAHCTSITDLALSHIKLRDAHLRTLLPSLPRLHRLHLSSGLDGLTCLSSVGESLVHLTIILGTIMPPARSLVKLRPLRRLQSLRMEMLCEKRRPTATEAAPTDSTLTNNDENTVFLPSLETMDLTLCGEGAVNLISLGRLPQLHTCLLRQSRDAKSELAPLLLFLAHTPSLAKITLSHPSLADAHLCALLPLLPKLHHLDLLRSSLGGVGFASSVKHLAHTLQSLNVSGAMPLRELRHLRALRELRHLTINVNITDESASSDSGLTAAAAHTIDAELVPFASLTTIAIDVLTAETGASPDLTFLGRMPALRVATITASVALEPQSIVDALVHSTRLTHVDLRTPLMTCDHLTALVQPLIMLRDLSVNSTCDFGDLSFARLPHLSRSLHRLSLQLGNSPSLTSMWPLRALTQIRHLTLRIAPPPSHDPTLVSPLVTRLREQVADFDLQSEDREFRDFWPHINAAYAAFTIN